MKVAIDSSVIQDVRFIGASERDNLYTHETYGSFNVSKMKLFLADPRVQNIRVLITDNTVRANAAADVCDEVIRTMTQKRADEPIILLQLSDEFVLVVDGNNRLRWRINHHRKDFRASLIPSSMLDIFKVVPEVLILGTWYRLDEKTLLDQQLGKHVNPNSPEMDEIRKNVAAWRAR